MNILYVAFLYMLLNIELTASSMAFSATSLEDDSPKNERQADNPLMIRSMLSDPSGSDDMCLSENDFFYLSSRKLERLRKSFDGEKESLINKLFYLSHKLYVHIRNPLTPPSTYEETPFISLIFYKLEKFEMVYKIKILEYINLLIEKGILIDDPIHALDMFCSFLSEREFYSGFFYIHNVNFFFGLESVAPKSCRRLLGLMFSPTDLSSSLELEKEEKKTLRYTLDDYFFFLNEAKKIPIYKLIDCIEETHQIMVKYNVKNVKNCSLLLLNIFQKQNLFLGFSFRNSQKETDFIYQKINSLMSKYPEEENNNLIFEASINFSILYNFNEQKIIDIIQLIQRLEGVNDEKIKAIYLLSFISSRIYLLFMRKISEIEKIDDFNKLFYFLTKEKDAILDKLYLFTHSIDDHFLSHLDEKTILSEKTSQKEKEDATSYSTKFSEIEKEWIEKTVLQAFEKDGYLDLSWEQKKSYLGKINKWFDEDLFEEKIEQFELDVNKIIGEAIRDFIGEFGDLKTEEHWYDCFLCCKPKKMDPLSFRENLDSFCLTYPTFLENPYILNRFKETMLMALESS